MECETMNNFEATIESAADFSRFCNVFASLVALCTIGSINVSTLAVSASRG